MKKSNHCQQRMSERGFSDTFMDVLLEHGDYIEQKGGSYVLALRNPVRIKVVRRQLANAYQEAQMEQKKLRQRRKSLGIRLVANDPTDELEMEIARHLRYLKKQLRSTKTGYAVFGKLGEEHELTAITVAHLKSEIQGYKQINE